MRRARLPGFVVIFLYDDDGVVLNRGPRIEFHRPHDFRGAEADFKSGLGGQAALQQQTRERQPQGRAQANSRRGSSRRGGPAIPPLPNLPPPLFQFRVALPRDTPG